MLAQVREAYENVTAGRKRPAIWLMAPSALATLQAESGMESDRLMGLPIRVIATWSFGWELLTAERAARRGITDLN